MALIIRSSAIHAAGCYTTTPIAKGRRVAQYTGLRLSKAEADTSYADSPITYLFGLGAGEIVIDGHCMAMFINHSCDANCETSEVRGRVWITYDYCLYDGGDDEAICNCGAKKCRGTMYSREEIRRRKRAAKKAAGKSTRKKRGKRNSAKTASNR